MILRYAAKRRTLQLQGKQTDLFGEVMAQISRDSDYSSALEGYVETAADGKNSKNKVSDVSLMPKSCIPYEKSMRDTDGGESRSITDRAVAKRIFDNLLDLVEYNANRVCRTKSLCATARTGTRTPSAAAF